MNHLLAAEPRRHTAPPNLSLENTAGNDSKWEERKPMYAGKVLISNPQPIHSSVICLVRKSVPPSGCFYEVEFCRELSVCCRWWLRWVHPLPIPLPWPQPRVTRAVSASTDPLAPSAVLPTDTAAAHRTHGILLGHGSSYIARNQPPCRDSFSIQTAFPPPGSTACSHI